MRIYKYILVCANKGVFALPFYFSCIFLVCVGNIFICVAGNLVGSANK